MILKFFAINILNAVNPVNIRESINVIIPRFTPDWLSFMGISA